MADELALPTLGTCHCLARRWAMDARTFRQEPDGWVDITLRWRRQRHTPFRINMDIAPYTWVTCPWCGGDLP